MTMDSGASQENAFVLQFFLETYFVELISQNSQVVNLEELPNFFLTFFCPFFTQVYEIRFRNLLKLYLGGFVFKSTKKMQGS